MTKREMFDVIANLCADNTEVVEFCEHEKELLARKKASGSKPTKTQIENEDYKKAMLDTMRELDREVTISELMEECDAISNLKNQRVSALMTQLKKSGQVVRTELKKKAYFSIA